MRNEDLEILAREFADVRPLPVSEHAVVERGPQLTPSEAQLARRAAALADPKHDPNYLSDREPPLVPPRAQLSFMRPGIQHGVFRSLRLGQYEPQSVLDLHRRTVQEARRELWQFIHDCRRYGLRTVMVLHGRGELSPKPALLKSYVNAWLRELPEVLAFHSAIKRDGGDGALYVLLKKSDEEKQRNRERHSTR